MDDMLFISLGRQYVEFCMQREQLIRQVNTSMETIKSLEDRLAKLEKKEE